MTRFAFLLAPLWAGSVLACDNDGMPLTPQGEDAPRAVLLLEDVPLAQPFSVQIELCDDAVVETLSVDAIMPAHQHGMNYIPTIVDLGDGLYQADGLLFHMPGAWKVQVELTQDTGVTRYSHTIELQ